ncbi:MAG TPA: hypothetical protein VG734_05125 [Lacunisphaera sp.]|nr:hypothetical protein [Lacunisphaera sp.]
METLVNSRSEVLERIFSLPLELHLRSQVSLLQLVKNTGYPALSGQIDVGSIKDAIRGRQGLIDAWLDYSREKPANWGWFIEGPDDGIYLVGSRTRSLEMPWQIREVEEACACFIKAELDAVLGRGP